MMKKLCFMLVCMYGVVCAQTTVTGDLSAYISTYIGNIPGEGTNLYISPSTSQLTTWGSALTNIIQGNYSNANTVAAGIGYEVVKYIDNSVSPNKTYYVMRKTTASTNYWGLLVFNPAPVRAKLAIMSPHPLHDMNTGQQGFYIFENVGARLFMVAGAHRCNATDSTTCDGTTDACSDDLRKYKISDQCHNVNSSFQRTTEILLSTYPNMIFFQPHGFSRDTGDPYLIISNGTRKKPATDYAMKIWNKLQDIDNTLTAKIIHIDSSWTKLTATNNTQGRLINGSSDPCDINPGSCNGRFIHIEQAYTGLRDNQTNWKKLSDAIAQAFPPASTVSSGNWSTADIWMEAQAPQSNDDVEINENHTVTVTTLVDSCRNLSFAAETAKLSFGASSILNVTGDVTLASTRHQAIGSWNSTAQMKFTGSALQTLTGWAPDTITTPLMNVIIDKSAGAVTTDGTGMYLGLGNSLDIVNGGFILAPNDNIYGHGITGSPVATTITVRANGVFWADSGTSTIRKGFTTDTVASRIGKLTIYGKAYISTADSAKKYNFGNIDVESGGEFIFSGGWKPTGFNPGIFTVKSGGTLTNTTTSSLWHSTAYLTLLAGSKLYISSSTISLPSQLNCSADTVEYFRSTTTSTMSNKITTFNSLILSGTVAKTLAANITVNGTLVVKGAAFVSGSGYKLSFGSNGTLYYNNPDAAQTTADAEFPATSGPKNVTFNNSRGVTLHAARTINGTLSLLSGTCTNASAKNITLGAGATIRRASGAQLAIAPVFGSSVNLDYCNTAATVTTGVEMPATTTILANLSLSGTQAVTLGANATVNGQVTLSSSVLNTGSYTLTFSSTASSPIETTTGYIYGTSLMSTGAVGTGSLSMLGATVTGTANLGNCTLTRVTGQAVSGGSNSSVAAVWKLTSSVSGPYSGRTIGISWPQSLDNGKTFTTTNRALTWYSANSGSSWSPVGSYTDVSASQIRAISAPLTNAFWFTASDSLHPLMPMVSARVLVEGLWDGTTMKADTITAELHSAQSPYNVLSTAQAVTNTDGTVLFPFAALPAQNVYIVCKHRNSIPVWSAVAVTPANQLAGMNYADVSTNTYGNNAVGKGGKFCMKSGDVNQDGIVNFYDMMAVDNDIYNRVSGYVATDLNNDGVVDFSDMLIVDNNSLNYAEIKQPQ
ncbi:MAG: hypothetical protein LWX56_10155 [Ignavibacteria bacterium]|nr:hypothetical protein [Ignavibacteria bacterium]